VIAGGSTSKSGGSISKALHAILSFSPTHVLQFCITSSCPRRPDHQFSLCSYFSISCFSVLTFFKGEIHHKQYNLLEIIIDLPFGFPINNIISLSNRKIGESRHSCTVKFGEVGRGHDVVKKNWNICMSLKERIACMA